MSFLIGGYRSLAKLHTLHCMAVTRKRAPATSAPRGTPSVPARERLTGGGNERQRAAHRGHRRRAARAAGGDRRDDPADRPAAVGAPVRGHAADRPVALKLASTGYRFVRYYTAKPALPAQGTAAGAAADDRADRRALHRRRVRQRGRAAVRGPSSRGTLLPIHKVSFFVWVAFMALHVLGHLPDRCRGAARRLRPLCGLRAMRTSAATSAGARGGCSTRGALVGGVVLAVLVIPEFGPWLHGSGLFTTTTDGS